MLGLNVERELGFLERMGEVYARIKHRKRVRVSGKDGGREREKTEIDKYLGINRQERNITYRSI